MAPKARWTVWGLIAGPLLPDTGAVEIGPLTIQTVASFAASGDLFAVKRPEINWEQASPSVDDPAALLLERLPELRSPWAFRVSVFADDSAEAYAEVDSLVSRVIAALDLLSDGPPYRAMLTSVRGPDGQVHTTSNIAVERRYKPQNLTNLDGQRALQWVRAIQANPKAQAAARLMADGMSLWDASAGSRPIQGASLLAFFRSLEIVVQDFDAPETDATERVAWTSQWRRQLGAQGTDVEKAVRRAWGELRSLENVTLERRIARAGAAWGLSDEIVATAQTFRVFRSEKLAHPTTDPPSDVELSAWLEGSTPRAYAVSIAYLRGYVASLVDRS
jgi:hypothetical protein